MSSSPPLRRRSSRPDRDRRARAVARLDPSLRVLRIDVIEHGLAAGRAVDADAASALLAAKAARAPEPVTLFTDDIVTELLWVDVHAWSGEHHVPPPGLVGPTLHVLVDVLAGEAALAPGSDPIDVLHEAIDAAGGASVESPTGGGRRDDGATVSRLARLDPA